MLGDFPLVVFTILSQTAIGALISLWILDSYLNKISIEVGKSATIAIFLTGAFGILASMLHLGHPFRAYLALTHLTNSWLSREVIFFGLFLLLLIIYYFQWHNGKENSRKNIGAITSLLALATVISSGMIYVLPAAPAWNNAMPVVLFALTSFLLGPLFLLAIIEYNLNLHIREVYKISFVAILIGMLSFLIYLSMLMSGHETSYLTGINMLQSTYFWLRVIIGWLVPLAVVISIICNKIKHYQNFALYIFVAALLGELIGRSLFYNTVVFLQISGF